MIHLKNINIFLSSTFNDMHAERDYIRKEVVPALNEKLEPFGYRINIIDLRWGVDTISEGEDNRESKVLRVCMDAIKDCKPYFIGLLGNRYGWMPPADRVEKAIAAYRGITDVDYETDAPPMSVTEMEIVIGSLSDVDMLDHSLFFFRNPVVYDMIDDWQLNQYVNSGEDASEKDRRQQTLKNKIHHACSLHGHSDRIITYTPNWDVDLNKFYGFEEIRSAIISHILSDLNLDNIELPHSNIPEETAVAEAFLGSLKRNFIGREEMVTKLLDYFQAPFDAASSLSLPRAFVVSGDSGSGKSSILAEVFYCLQKEATNNPLVLLHAAGVTENTIKEDGLLRNIVHSLSGLCDITLEDSEIPYKELIPDLIKKCQTQGRNIVLLIDSVEYLDIDLKRRFMSFLPASVRMLITAQPREAELLILNNRDFQRIDIGDYSIEDARQLIAKTLHENYKELPHRLTDLILQKTLPNGKPSFSNPMWLQIVMSALMELGSEDFQTIKDVDVDADDLKIELYLENFIKAVPASVEDLFLLFIEKASSYFDENFIKRSICLIALSRYGISEGDLADMMGDEWNELAFMNIRRWLGRFLYKSPVDGRISLSHSILKNIALLFDEKTTNICRMRRTAFLWNSYKRERLMANELCLWLIQQNDFESFNSLLYEGFDFSYLLKEDIVYGNHKIILNFLVNYVELYPVNFGLATAFLEDLFSRSIQEPLYSQFAEYLFTSLESKFDRNKLLDGDSETFGNFVNLFNGPCYKYEVNEDLDGMREVLNNLKFVYFSLRSRFPVDAGFMPPFVEYGGFFHLWKTFLFMLHSKDKYGEDSEIVEEYKSNLFQLISELEWYVENVDDPITQLIAIPNLLSLELTAKNLILGEEDLVCLAKEVKGIITHYKNRHENTLNSVRFTDIDGFINELDRIIDSTSSIPPYFTLPQRDGYTDYRESQMKCDVSEKIQALSDSALELDLAEQLLSELNKNKNYNVSDNTLDLLLDLAGKYWNDGNQEQYFRFMEGVCQKLKHNLYHHYDSSGFRNLFAELVQKYSELGDNAKAFDLSYEILDIVVRGHLEKYFDIYEFEHRDTSHLHPYYVLFLPFVSSNPEAKTRFEKDLTLIDSLSAYNPNSEYHFSQQFGRARMFHEGLAAVQNRSNNLWGFADSSGALVIPYQFREVGDFHEGLAWFCPGSSKEGFGYRGATFGFIDHEGKVIFEPNFDDISSFLHGYAIAYENDNLLKIYRS